MKRTIKRTAYLLALVLVLSLAAVWQNGRKQVLNGFILPLPGESRPAAAESEPAIDENAYYPVARVVDGDTIKVDIGGQTETVRLLGIDTPELKDARGLAQCFAKEARDKAREWLEGKKVKLEADRTQADRDKYGRLLRYVIREDGFFYDLEIIKAGYAHEYTYDLPYGRQEEFRKAENSAREARAGLWADGACGQGQRSD